MKMTRRQFMCGAAETAAAATAASAATAGIGTAMAADEVADWDREFDVAVIGSGMGGFASAFAAMEAGLSVGIVEISATTGGGSAFSGGLMHLGGAGESPEAAATWPEGLTDQRFTQKLQAGFQELVGWLQDKGLKIQRVGGDGPMGIMGEAELGMAGCREFFDSCQTYFVDNGGTLLMRTAAKHLVTDASGAVVGVECQDLESGAIVRIGAKAVVIACGGFQASPELRTRYFGRYGSMATNESVPYARGAGMRMAQEVGATLAGSFETFAGAWISAKPAHNPMEEVDEYESAGFDDDGKYFLYEQVMDSLPAGCIIVNSDGKRFTDEAQTLYRTQQQAMQQFRASVIMVCDDPAWQDWMTDQHNGHRTTREQIDEVITSERVGGTFYEAATLEELADAMNAAGIATHGVHKANLLRTVSEYNEAVEAGTTEDLEVARTNGKIASLEQGPFHAWPMTLAVYACFGGIAIDTDARVIDDNCQVIPGLYATFPAAGGIMREFYHGAITTAALTGKWAGEAAAAQIAGI